MEKVFVQPGKRLRNYIVKRISSLLEFQKAYLRGCVRFELCYNQTYILIPRRAAAKVDDSLKLINWPVSLGETGPKVVMSIKYCNLIVCFAFLMTVLLSIGVPARAQTPLDREPGLLTLQSQYDLTPHSTPQLAWSAWRTHQAGPSEGRLHNRCQNAFPGAGQLLHRRSPLRPES